jgi:outer membrane receptor for ferrienterochelin and colicin
LYSIDAGVQKTINDKMKLKLNVQNIFNAKLWSESITTSDVAHSSILRMDTRVVMLSFNYIFGNQKAKEFKQRSSSEDESRRAN